LSKSYNGKEKNEIYGKGKSLGKEKPGDLYYYHHLNLEKNGKRGPDFYQNLKSFNRKALDGFKKVVSVKN
jgi:hypothetical protein